jgi:hypothetical protein
VKGKSTIVIGAIVLAIVAFSACSKLLPSMIDREIGICGPVSLTDEQTVLFSAGNDRLFANRTIFRGKTLDWDHAVVNLALRGEYVDWNVGCRNGDKDVQ